MSPESESGGNTTAVASAKETQRAAEVPIEAKNAKTPQKVETINSDAEKAPASPTPEDATQEEAAKPRQKIDLEITNPDDIKLDDKGQLGLF